MSYVAPVASRHAARQPEGLQIGFIRPPVGNHTADARTAGRRQAADDQHAGVFNAIYYQVRTSCPWRDLPHDFQPEGTVRRWFHHFKHAGIYEKINEQLRKAARVQAGREGSPSLAIIDSQSVKATRTSGERGFDAGKKSTGLNAISSWMCWG